MAGWNPFRKKSKDEYSEWVPSEEENGQELGSENGPGELVSHETEPRPEYYSFVHLVLRDLAREMPLEILAMLASPEGRQQLKRLWEDIAERSRQRIDGEIAEPFPELEIHCLKVEDHLCGVIEMPPPRGITEAWFIAIVLLSEIDFEQTSADRKAEIAYLVLEKGSSIDGTPRTVFCEWSAVGAHLNFGDGPPPTLYGFLERITEYLRQQ